MHRSGVDDSFNNDLVNSKVKYEVVVFAFANYLSKKGGGQTYKW